VRGEGEGLKGIEGERKECSNIEWRKAAASKLAART
jgi:hypothetical protein